MLPKFSFGYLCLLSGLLLLRVLDVKCKNAYFFKKMCIKWETLVLKNHNLIFFCFFCAYTRTHTHTQPPLWKCLYIFKPC